MRPEAPARAKSTRREGFALLTYLALLAGLVMLACAMLSNLLDAYAELGEKREALARFERQSQHPSPTGSPPGSVVDAPPFLLGKTVTVAGAGLQERVETAIAKAGGSVMSSQIDFQIPRAPEGFVGLTSSLEIKQENLQSLLYDLEAGMPYLFVENLSIESPQGFGEPDSARMRVLIGVTGQWRETP
jgi:general secretion pathway protein M